MSGFSDPIIGGSGSLVYPQIKSPNFSLAGQTGWAILKNGDAYFFNVVAEGTITATAFLGTDFVINSAGMFFYSGTPAKGNLILAIAPVAGGTDAVGNVYPQGVNFGTWNASGALEQHFGIDAAGRLYLANSSGNTVMLANTNDGSLLFYNSSGIGAGNLDVSISPVSGTDTSGNTYKSGVEVQGGGAIRVVGTGGLEIVMEINGGEPLIAWFTGVTEEAVAANAQAFITNAGASETMELALVGAKGTVQDDQVGIILSSGAKDGSLTAGGALSYLDTSGVEHLPLEWGNTGVKTIAPLSGDTNLYPVGAAHVVGAPAQTINLTSNIPITGATLPVGIGTYIVEATVWCTNGANAANQALGINGPTESVINVELSVDHTSGASTTPNLVNSHFTAYGRSGLISSGINGGVLPAAATFTVKLRGYITFTAAGNFVLNASCVTAAADTWTVNAFELELIPNY